MSEIRTIIILTGAGISAESGIATFRGPGGLWEGHRVEDGSTAILIIGRPFRAVDDIDGRWHISAMLAAINLLAVALSQAGDSSSRDFDFSRSYVVWIATDARRCSFFMTDAGEDAKQLADTLRRNYDPAAGIEILTDDDTPAKCISQARKAVKKGGFANFRVRRGTDADRSPGIP